LRILAIGDPHGKLPYHLKAAIRNGRPDAILCTGDFPDFSEKRQFAYWREIDSLQGRAKRRVIQRYLRHRRRGVLAGVKVLKELDSFGLPVFVVHGNNDITPRYPWARKGLPESPGLERYSIEEVVRSLRNVALLEYSHRELKGYSFYGFGCKFITPQLPLPTFEAFMWRHLVELEKNEFRRFFESVDPRKVIILSHDPPYGTRLDRVGWKGSPRFGEHVGDFVMKEFALRYEPLLWVCGNVHENFGTMRLGQTLVVNAGYGREGDGAWIELDGRARVTLIR